MYTHPIAVSARDAASMLSISERAFHEYRKNPGFPKPRSIGTRNRWIVSELLSYLENSKPVDIKEEPKQLVGTDKTHKRTQE